MEPEAQQRKHHSERNHRLTRVEWWFCWTLLFPIPIASSAIILLSMTSLKMAFSLSTSGTLGMFATSYGLCLALPLFTYVLFKKQGKLLLWAVSGWIFPFLIGWMISPSIVTNAGWITHYNHNLAEFRAAARWLDQQGNEPSIINSRIPNSIQSMARDAKVRVAADPESNLYLVIPVVHVWIDDGTAFVYSKSRVKPSIGSITNWFNLGDGWWLVKYT